ncbi:uncharacterized protein LOC116352335 isoform X1 [Contarinia nasturtii]|uniref:uncharacterized protein LOC116352335 isoform X1 n=1 Tax=Contarinia nasturtii TaxID=265458 RepID=UPI0012D39EB9|nr:uncharacterized protein LOC116352335 isoform X1 [Contarinia nasturtii]
MAREESRGKRPLKIWDSWRNVRKGLVVGSFEELLVRGKDKLCVPASEPVRVVLECDGTQIEDGEYFRTLANNTVLLLLRQGERWFPTGVDVIKADLFFNSAISAIPRIVCETIHALELHDETPSWKIMDNKGRVTVVMCWDHHRQGNIAGSSSATGSTIIHSSSGVSSTCNGPFSSIPISPSKKSSGISAQSSIDKMQQRYPSPQITVINHDDIQSTYGSGRRLPKQGGGSFDSVHIHTPECSHHVHTPSRAGSPSAECDFHCCSLHEEGREIASVATSPIQDGIVATGTSAGGGTISTSPSQRRTPHPKGHVRFLDIQQERESSESETENTVMEDETITSEKFLLLIDQLSVDQKRHLNIKDIGIILERLSAKIVDVERLDRESESDDCYNWTMKATIRGEALRELGVIYNGNYYAISEHPGYKEENEELGEEEIEEEDEDRL